MRGLHVVAVLEGEVLFGQLVDQLLVAIFFAIRVQFRDLLRGKETHPVLRPTSRQALKHEVRVQFIHLLYWILDRQMI